MPATVLQSLRGDITAAKQEVDEALAGIDLQQQAVVAVRLQRAVSLLDVALSRYKSEGR